MENLYSTSPKHQHQPKQHAATSLAAPELAQPWTATRCHRLLRPLLAHIAALRKDKERRTLIRGGQTSTSLSQNAKPRRTVLGKRSYPGSDSDYSDKKTCRKYSRKASRRRSSSEHSSTTPQRNAQKQRRQPDNKVIQDVVLVLRRVRNHLPSSPAQAVNDPEQEEPTQANSRCHHSGGRCKTKCAFEIELNGLRSTMDAERHGLYESVFKAFDSILKVSSPRKNQAAGPKSFLAMCLRKVPACMAALEEWKRENDESKGAKSTLQGAGISFEIYSELETLGAVDGWKHLCLLVRAHGVQIIQDAVSEGLLEDPVTDLLIRVCLEYMPATEFKGLIDAFVIRQYPKPHSPEDDLDDLFTSPGLQPLRVLRSCDPSGISFMSGVLANLLADGLLPCDWILTKSFISLWPSMVRLVTEMKSCQGTVDFIITTLEHLCGLASPRKPRGVPQTRLRGKPQTTLISTLAALGSVVLLSEEGSTQIPPTPSTTTITSSSRAAAIRRRLEYITTTCIAHLKRRPAPSRKLGTYLLSLCAFLSLPPCPDTSPSSPSQILSTSWLNVPTCRGNAALMLQYDATTALMASVAHYCGRGTELPPHLYLTQFCDRLEMLDLPRGALKNMRVDAAFRLAECTGDLRDLEIAEGWRDSIGTPVQRREGGDKGEMGKRKAKGGSFSGIRWDEGISEWVAATPGTEVRKGKGRVLRSRRGVEVEQQESEEVEESSGSSETETEEESGSGSESDDESDAVSVSGSEMQEEESLTPGTEMSPGPFSDPEINWGKEMEMETKGGSEPEPEPESDSAADPLTDEQQPPPTASSKSSPPPPGGFLAARPRRLSRRLALPGAGDELAIDEVNESEKENWLCRKKPARFRLGASVENTPSKGKGKAGMKKARVARASLVYLQPVDKEKKAIRKTGVVQGRGFDAGDDSDDELSIL